MVDETVKSRRNQSKAMQRAGKNVTMRGLTRMAGNRARNYYKNVVYKCDYKIPGMHCTSAALSSIYGAFAGPAVAPEHLLTHLVMGDLMRAPLRSNCGSNLGKPAKLTILYKAPR